MEIENLRSLAPEVACEDGKFCWESWRVESSWDKNDQFVTVMLHFCYISVTF